MGVPKFYRWISERYPCLSEVVKEYQIPEFDNFYLDMNGIVHICSHPEDDNPHFRITEEKIFQDIFHYLEVLFRMIKPNRVFFMAIDGVAPRAKMNQQRGRRFRSAKEAEELARKAVEKGEVLPTEERFDSNCITPGTPFMVRLQEQLKYFIAKKLTTDKIWQGVNIYLSGHETPGEGEHKIMDFIRWEKSQPGHDPNTRHCLYGLDADLIMLGLITHEPHFSLLREEVRFGGKNSQKRSNAAEDTTFHLLHLSLMREYMDFEFGCLKDKLSFGYELDNIIDDWVLMGFLVGNDFIPHLPHMHIHSDCLPMLWRIYKKLLPTLDGYLAHNGELNLARFEKFLKEVSQNDKEQFNEQYADLKWMESKVGKKPINEDAARGKAESKVKGYQKPKLSGRSAISSDIAGIPTANEFMMLRDVDDDTNQLRKLQGKLGDSFEFEKGECDDDFDDDDEMFNDEFAHHKASYYMTKMNYPEVTPEVLREQSEGYVRAIAWILQYYYNGCPSWSWYYPHHYAPYLSDVKDFKDMTLEFERGMPFFPFQQLMAVLPAASKKLLPKPLQNLMLNESSPVIDYYPVEFSTDLNGKLQEWEAVVLIPFIDETRLLSAMKPVEAQLSDDEKSRNTHGPALLYQYTEEVLGTYPSFLPGSFPDIVNHHAKLTKIPIDKFWVKFCNLKKGLCEGVKQDLYFPGFPTLKHIEHACSLTKAGVKVFQQNSRGENMMLEILAQPERDVEEVANELLGEAIFVGWPHLFEARVVCVQDEEFRYSISDNPRNRRSDNKNELDIQVEEVPYDERKKWRKEVVAIQEFQHDRKGVEVGVTDILVYACPMSGRKYTCSNRGVITLEKQWANNRVPYPLQATVKDIAVKDPTFQQFKTLDELYPLKTEVFMLGNPHYGCSGEVLSIEAKNDGRIRVDFTILQEPDFNEIRQQQESLSARYMPGYVCAQRIGISGFLLSRITGVLFVLRGSKERPISAKTNVGLNLKFNKTQQEIPGYTKKSNGDWLYSTQLIGVVSKYIDDYPDLFDYIASTDKEANYYEEGIWGSEGKEKLQGLSKYIKELPTSKIAPVTHGSKLLDELVVQEIQKEVENIKELNKKKKKHVKMQVRPHLLYRPLDAQLTLVPDPSAQYELFDRIVNVRDGYSVPLGLRGTVIGVSHGDKEQDTSIDIVYDDEFLGGLALRCSKSRGYKMPASALINLSYGERKENVKKFGAQKPTAVVKPQYAPGGTSYSQMLRGDNRRGNNGGQNNRGYNQRQNNDGHNHQGQRGNHQGNQRQQEHNRPAPQPAAAPEQGNSDEFANIWQQLQKSDATHGGQKQNSRNQPQTNQNRKPHHQKQAQGGMPSLQQAAKALENVQFEHRWQPSKDDPQRPQNLPEPGANGPKHHDQKKKHGGKHKNEPTANEGGQKINVNDLFNIPGRVDVNKPDVAASDQGANKDFSNILKALEGGSAAQSGLVFTNSALQQPETQDNNQEGTKTLCQMLNIGPPSAEAGPSAPQQTTQETKKSYGKQVSLNELFQGASGGNEAEQAHPQRQQKQPHPQQRQQHPHPQQPQMPPQNVHQYHHQQPQQQRRSAVLDLAGLCQSVNLFPAYEYQPGRDNKVRAIIRMSNGSMFQGSYARSRDAAADSAAAVALLNLRGMQAPFMNVPHGQRYPSTQYGGPRAGNFSASPNSAFTPVQGKQQGNYQQYGHGSHQRQPQQGQHPQTAPFYGGNQQFPNTANNQGPMHGKPQHHGQYKQGKEWRGGGGGGQGQGGQHQHRRQRQYGDEAQRVTEDMAGLQVEKDFSPRTPSKNPFIPTQVLRQQKTPQRDTKPADESGFADEYNTAAPKVTFYSAPANAKTDSEADAKPLASTPKVTPIKPKAERAAPRQDSLQTPDSKPQPRRPKSRIAANFGAPKS